jgi:hypothetical protein
LVHNQDITSLLDKVGVIYRLDCLCGKTYIGQTGRKLGVRIKEHIENTKKRNSNSPWVAHANAMEDPSIHKPDIDSVKIIKSATKYRERIAMEALFINACLPSSRLINLREETAALRNKQWRQQNFKAIREMVFGPDTNIIP